MVRMIAACVVVFMALAVPAVGEIDVSPRSVAGSGVSHETVFFESDAVGRPMRFEVILPVGYGESDARYPVLYMLHGLGGDYRQWLLAGALEYAAGYGMIIVLPDAGNSFYVNWAVSEDGKRNNWEDLITDDIVGLIDAHYRTVPRREGRAIGGLSMGGNGATTIGLRHPELFCSISSHSGLQTGLPEVRMRFVNGLHPSPPMQRQGWMVDFDHIPGFGTFEERTPRGRVVTSEEQIDAHDARKLVLAVPRDELPDIYITCGTEDFLFGSFQAMTAIMREHGIPHTAKQSGGGHDFAYWARELRYSMAHQYQVMDRALARAGIDR